MIDRLLKCTHIIVINVILFFYQWRTHFNSRKMLIVISHRKQKTFNVLIIKCINSITYIQRQINNILRSIKTFIKIYINDVIIKAKSLTEHLFNLRSLFQLFIKHNISISPIKTFLNYSNVNLLKRRVNFIKLFTIENKLEIIKTIKYSTTLKGLKHYFDLTNYLRNNVHYYAQLT